MNSRRLVYLTVGWIFTGLGFVGAFLPLLPTTPFLLVAVWAFSKSSPRLRRWLFTHPKFGPHIRAWFEQGAISQRAKVLALSLMTVSFGFSAYITADPYVIGGLGVVFVALATFILTRPTPKTVAIKSQ